MKLSILIFLQAILSKKFMVKTKADDSIRTVECDCMDNLPGNVIEAEEDLEISMSSIQRNPVWGLARVSNNADYLYPDTSSETNVYILDTGIDIGHHEFEGRASWGANFIDDKDWDCQGHGTHVAGTIGSATFGTHKHANLIGVKVLGCDGRGSTSGIISAIEWVISEHAKNSCKKSIINMSLGGKGRSIFFQQVLNKAQAAGILTVVAAGNSSDNACDYFPAGYDNVITVGATTVDNKLASFSNYGECVNILAPGKDILSTYLGNSVSSMSGTSMAAPHVAGIASLIMSYCNYTPEEITQEIMRLSRDDVIRDLQDDTINKLLFSDDQSVKCPENYCSPPPPPVDNSSQRPPSTPWGSLICAILFFLFL